MLKTIKTTVLKCNTNTTVKGEQMKYTVENKKESIHFCNLQSGDIFSLDNPHIIGDTNLYIKIKGEARFSPYYSNETILQNAINLKDGSSTLIGSKAFVFKYTGNVNFNEQDFTDSIEKEEEK